LIERLRPGILGLTGREDFQWKERYVFGYGDPDEYEELKKERASYTDQFELAELVPEEQPEGDLLAQVRRCSDAECQILNDYATWVANYQ
jgi:hypothetical protein